MIYDSFTVLYVIAWEVEIQKRNLFMSFFLSVDGLLACIRVRSRGCCCRRCGLGQHSSRVMQTGRIRGAIFLRLVFLAVVRALKATRLVRIYAMIGSGRLSLRVVERDFLLGGTWL